jgi:hypothetical protein
MNSNLSKPLSLRSIVAELLSVYNPKGSGRSSVIINDASNNHFVYQRKNWIEHLLGDLYTLLGSVAKDETIHITACIEKNDIKLYLIKDEHKKTILLNKLIPRFFSIAEK